MPKENTNNHMDAPASGLNQKTYNPDWINEYKMIREELVNYIDKLQEIRNMMFAAVGTVFALSVSDKIPFLCVLLPLLFILPSYANVANYWTCVRKASAYLVVFHESYEDCPMHWESRHNMLKRLGKRNTENFKKSTFYNISSQLACYYVCTAITMIVYALRLYKYATEKIAKNSSLVFWDITIDGIPISAYIIIGIAIIIFLFIFFIRASMGDSYADYLAKFLLIKDREKQRNIGKCWSDELPDKSTTINDLQKISEKLKEYL